MSIWYKQVDCPHCGNQITVKSVSELQKCRWCRRPVKVTVYGAGKKATWDVEPVDFSQSGATKSRGTFRPYYSR